MAELLFLKAYPFALKTCPFLIWYIFPDWPRGYKTFFVLNSIEHEILNAHKYRNIKKFGLFKAQLSLECYFFPLIHVKMPTVVGILTFMSGEKFMLN